MLIFLFLRKNIHWGYWIELPQRGNCNEHPLYVFMENWKNDPTLGLNIANACCQFLVTENAQILINPLEDSQPREKCG